MAACVAYRPDARTATMPYGGSSHRDRSPHAVRARIDHGYSVGPSIRRIERHAVARQQGSGGPAMGDCVNVNAIAPDPVDNQNRIDTAKQRERVVRDVRLIVAAMHQSARALEEATGLTNAQCFLLRQLAADGPLCIGELTARAVASQSAISLLVNRLESSGYVRRQSSAKDARRTEVMLTAPGRRIASNCPEPPVSRLVGAVKKLRGIELRRLAASIDALVRAMGIHDEEAALLFESAKPARRTSTRR